MIKKDDRVVVRLLDAAGCVSRAWQDDLGGWLFRVELDDPSVTLSGWYVARESELREEGCDA